MEQEAQKISAEIYKQAENAETSDETKVTDHNKKEGEEPASTDSGEVVEGEVVDEGKDKE